MDVLDKLIKQGKVNRIAGYVGHDGNIYMTEVKTKDGVKHFYADGAKDDKHRKPAVQQDETRTRQP